MNESQDSNDSSTSNPNDIRQQEAEHQGAAVKAALGANIGVAIAKLAAAFFTGSSAMLSESVHSIADCSNEIVLMAGGRFSKHKTDGDHPFGFSPWLRRCSSRRAGKNKRVAIPLSDR